MRLQPVEHPSGLMLRFAYWMTRRKFGKVITPMKVVTARVPKSMRVSYEISKMMEHGFYARQGIAVPAAHAHFAGQPMPFLHRYRAGDGPEGSRIAREDQETGALSRRPAFTAAERAALAYVEEVSQTKTASDATFEELRRHFSDQQIVEITLLNAFENYYNLVNRPLEIESDGLCALVVQRNAAKPIPR